MTDDASNPCLAAAIAYARNPQRPLFVFPAKPGEKKSRVAGRHSADGKNWGMTNNLNTIQAYWNKWPDSNVCIVTGEINGIFVVETDTADHGKDGESALLALVAANGGEWPDTLTARSPSGSIHYYFTWPDNNITILNSDNKLAPGVDVRGEGGMVVAPPSINPKYATRYEWISNEGIGIVKAPKWLLDLIASKLVSRRLGDPQAPVDKIAQAMELIPNHDAVVWDVPDFRSGEVKVRTGWDGWNDISMALYRATAGSEEGFKIFDKWCQKNGVKYNAKYTRYSWFRRYVTSPPRGIGAGTLFMLADEYAPGWRGIWEEEHPEETAAQKQEFKENRRAEDIAETKKAITVAARKQVHKKADFTIKVTSDEIHTAVDLTEESLLAISSPFYIYGGMLMMPVTTKVRSHDEKMTTIATFHEVQLNYMLDHTNRHIDYKSYDVKAKDWKSIDPPLKVITRLLARVSVLKFPKVSGLITTPTMRPDGSLLLEAGYDAETGLLLVDPPSIDPIPDKPTQAQAAKALALLEDLLDEFPFADDVAKAVALSALITPIVRGAFPVAPMHVNRAPVMSSGKSYLFDCVATMAIGQNMPATAAGQNDEETEKRLGAALLSGQPLINIDNVNGLLGGDALCQYIERPTVSIRILGKSENKTIESRGTTFFATGNNITLVGDMTRRVVISTLDPKIERPELREFRKQPKAMIAANRGKYISAALTVCKAYVVAGRPGKAKPLGSFEAWSDTVRSALMWLGKADPVESMEIARDEDPKLVEHRALLLEWASVIGRGRGQRVTLSSLIEEATSPGSGGGYSEFDFKWPDLNAAVMRVASVYNRPPDLTRLGNWMRMHKNRVLDGLRFVQEPNAKGSSKWWVERVSDPDEDVTGLRLAENVVKPSFGDR